MLANEEAAVQSTVIKPIPTKTAVNSIPLSPGFLNGRNCFMIGLLFPRENCGDGGTLPLDAVNAGGEPTRRATIGKSIV